MHNKLLYFTTLLCSLLFANVLQAQQYAAGPPPPLSKQDKEDESNISITPFYGYNFDETFEIDGGSVYLNDGSIFGVSLGIEASPYKEIELTYQRQVVRASADLFYFLGNSYFETRANDDIAIDYFMIGFNGMKKTSDRITLYGGISAGMVVFTPQTYNVNAAEKFAVALKGGVRVNLTDRIGIRLQPQLYMPIQSLGANVFFGTGGSGVGISGYSTITQFGGIGGLSYAF
jgi:hypothetical protein